MAGKGDNMETDTAFEWPSWVLKDRKKENAKRLNAFVSIMYTFHNFGVN